MQGEPAAGSEYRLLLQRRATIVKADFPRSSRILKRAEYERVQNAGRRVRTRHFLILVASSKLPESRLGTIITKKVDKRSVMRNKLRRRLRDIFRLNRHKLTNSFELVIIARKDAERCSYIEIKDEILAALENARVLART